jgi:phospho-N-acetylmuramoyl-pentapeptide-transferase
MLYCFSKLACLWGGFHVFRFISFRSLGALLTSFLIAFCLGKPFIKKILTYQKGGQPIRLDGPSNHLESKKGIPTMGGVLILVAMTVSALLWARLNDPSMWCVLLTTLAMGILGGIDDFRKVSTRNSNGISATKKLIFQVLIAFCTLWAMEYFDFSQVKEGVTLVKPHSLYMPFLKNYQISLGWFFLVFGVLVVVGSSNAVNLTDGLDGLAIGPVMICASVFAVLSYILSNVVFAPYLKLPYIPYISELPILCACVVGAGLGFLWYNAPPAMIFMGDTGSLALGGFLGAVAIITKHEYLLVLCGGVFVLETLSVIIQVSYYKRRKKRVFLMAPIHHHFEKKGWSESAIMVRFWIISTLLAVLGLATLKLR